MLAARKQKLAIVAFIILGSALTVGLAIFALNEGINVYFTPSEIAAGEAPVGRNIRIGGMVKMGSLQKGALEGARVEFIATDCAVDIPVVYDGVVPDLFREGQGVVANGFMDEMGVFQAQEILAKHDENYMAAESQAAMDASGASCNDS